MELVRALKRPFANAKTLLIGVILSIVPIVNFIAVGYFLETAKATMKKNYKPLPFKRLGSLFIKGLLATVIGFIYILPVLAVAVLGIGLPFLNLFAFGKLDTTIPDIGLALALVMILVFIAAYFIPAAYISYITRNKFKAGFDFRTIGRKALNSKYLAAWLVGTLYTLGISLGLSLLFFFFPYLGAAIGSFIGGVTTYTLLGQAWASVK